MGALLGASAFALVALWILAVRLRARFQNVSQAADRVAAQLGRNTLSDNSATTVEVWDCHPLSIPMIKELALSKGYAFTEESFSRRNGARILRFKPPKPKSRSLDL
jgi:hypothetical protein